MKNQMPPRKHEKREGHEKESKSVTPSFANLAASLCALCGFAVKR